MLSKIGLSFVNIGYIAESTTKVLPLTNRVATITLESSILSGLNP